MVKDIVIAVALGATAVVAYKVVPTIPMPSFSLPTFDSSIYPYSREEAEAMLADARTTLPRRDGIGKIQIWGAGRSDRGVKLNMKYDHDAPLLTCEAVITAVDPTQSRVVADCGGSTSDSAVARTTKALEAPMHLAAILEKRPFERENATRKEKMIVLRNMSGMQSEGMQHAMESARGR